MGPEEAKTLIKRVRAGLRVTKVVSSRSIKGRTGDTFVGFSAAWNTVQEDGGQGLVSSLDEGEETLSGMSLQEALVASAIVSREADLAAYRNAAAGGNISTEHANVAISAVKANYNRLLVEILGVSVDEPHE